MSDLPSEVDAQSTEPLVVIEAETLSFEESDGLRMMRLGEHQVLLFPLGQEPVEASAPIPATASGAGYVVVSAMADQPFAFEVQLPGAPPVTTRGPATRRRWRDVAFALGAPLARIERESRSLVLRRVESAVPVAVRSIRFLR